MQVNYDSIRIRYDFAPSSHTWIHRPFSVKYVMLQILYLACLILLPWNAINKVSASCSDPCQRIEETAINLNFAINEAMANSNNHQWGVNAFLPASISGLDEDRFVSMDVPSIVSVNYNTQWVAVFHSIHGGEGEDLFALYVAESNVALSLIHI